MLRILGHASRACDGLTRRELLTAGSLALLGPALGRSTEALPGGTAKAVILIDLFGDPSHIDSFDPKPDAPAEVRGEFATIATRHPGVRFTEHVPRLARLAHRFCLIRTVSHRYNSHNPSSNVFHFRYPHTIEKRFSRQAAGTVVSLTDTRNR